MLANGYESFLASVVEKKTDEKLKVGDVVIVREFQEVFPDDLPGLPLDKEIEFEIEVAPRTDSINKAPYHMAPAKLKELHT